MKRFILIVVTMALVFMVGSPVTGQTARAPYRSPENLLQQSDLTRNGWPSFSNVTEIRNYEDGELKDDGKFEISMKGFSKTLVRFLNPDVKGEYLLMLDDAMWIYMPNTRKPIRITPLQRLLGDASNGDVARTHYAEDYTAASMRDEVLDGTPCSVLDLTPRLDGATYARIEYWIASETVRPLKAEIYLTSGKHYKTIHYDKYGTISGRVLLLQMTITDRLREGRTTIMAFSEYAPKDIPEKYFNKDYLEKLR